MHYMEGETMAIELTDDGTMDTVLRCSECGEEFRFTYSPGPLSDEDSANRRESADEEDYQDWIAGCIEEIENEHECDQETLGPQEEDITTEDYERFYYCGKQIVHTTDDDWMPAVGAWCKKSGYFPNVWFISDHGNAHIISVSNDGRYLNGYSE